MGVIHRNSDYVCKVSWSDDLCVDQARTRPSFRPQGISTDLSLYLSETLQGFTPRDEVNWIDWVAYNQFFILGLALTSEPVEFVEIPSP